MGYHGSGEKKCILFKALGAKLSCTAKVVLRSTLISGYSNRKSFSNALEHPKFLRCSFSLSLLKIRAEALLCHLSKKRM